MKYLVGLLVLSSIAMADNPCAVNSGQAGITNDWLKSLAQAGATIVQHTSSTTTSPDWARGISAAAKASGGHYILCVDNDNSAFSPDWLRSIAQSGGQVIVFSK